MVREYNITLPWPPTINTYWRHVVIKGRSVTLLSKKGREYQHAASGELLRQGAVCCGLSERLAVSITAYPPDRRKRDLDNLPKAVLDAMTKANVWEDDSQIDDLRITRGHIVKGGHLDIVITTIEAIRS